MSKQHNESTIFVNPKFGPSEKPWDEQVPNIAKSNNLEAYPSGYIIQPPSEDPLDVYNRRSQTYPFQQNALNEKFAQLPPDGQGEDYTTSLEVMQSYYQKQRSGFTGYQCVEQFDISQAISPFLNMSLNNIGDPFEDGYFTMNAKQAERGVLDFFASLWHGQWPSLPKPSRLESASETEYLNSTDYEKYKESYWGYILSMGSTEGNLYAVLSARDYLSGFSLVVDDAQEESLCPPKMIADDPNKYIPVAFYSEAAHYSLAKAVHAMQVKTFSQIAHEHLLLGESGWDCPLGGDWPDSVPTEETGSVKVDDLVTLVTFFAEKGYPVFICFNYGTTFKGAYDDIPHACEKLNPVFRSNGLDDRVVEYIDTNGELKTDHRRGYWVHIDGALGASLMPFVEMAVAHGKLDKTNLGPCFDFRNDEVMSVVTSGHKWPSASAPTGIYMTKNKYLITPVATPDYLGSSDTTFAGSRNGLSAMVLWNLIAHNGIPGLVEMAEKTMNLCGYTSEKFIALQQKLGDFDIWLQRAPHGGTSFIFRKPVDDIMFRYSLPIEVEITKQPDGTIRKRTYVHLFVFWDRDKNMIDNLIEELSLKDAFDAETEEVIGQAETKAKLQGVQLPPKLLKRTSYKGFR
jgi:histidine decarboxylase